MITVDVDRAMLDECYRVRESLTRLSDYADELLDREARSEYAWPAMQVREFRRIQRGADRVLLSWNGRVFYGASPSQLGEWLNNAESWISAAREVMP